MIPHDGLVITPFQEFRGTYEYYKAQALVKHLRALIEIVSRAQSVGICPEAPERPWIGLQEWTNNNGMREGQWGSDLKVEQLR